MSSVGADDLCQRVEDHLREHLTAFLPDDLEAPSVWEQLPSVDAMDTVAYPAVAVSCPGTEGPWEKNGRKWSATWRVVVSVWVQDDGYSNVASAVRRYVLAVRTCLLAAHDPNWRPDGESYARIDDPALSQTLGAGAVDLLVTATAADTSGLTLTPGVPLPLVHVTSVTVSAKE